MILTIICTILLFAGAVIIARKIHGKVYRRLLFCLLILVVVAVGVFGNTFLCFQTPEDASRYLSTDPIVDTVEGENSCLVITQKDRSTFNNNFFMKSGDGYRAITPFQLQRNQMQLGNGRTASIYTIKGTMDDYVLFFDTTPIDRESVITDTNGTVFRTVTFETGTADNVIFAYAYVGQIGEDYEVYVTSSSRQS